MGYDIKILLQYFKVAHMIGSSNHMNIESKDRVSYLYELFEKIIANEWMAH
jgi:hypothetical protein